MVASAHLHCAKCGTDNPIHAAFCFACGSSLQSTVGGLIISSSTGSLVRNHLLAGLQHPNIPAIYDYFGEAGHWYLVMDFIEGDTLEEHLGKSRGRYLPVEEVLDIGMQLCTVLGYLHTRQPPIIFRDLKPANILLTSSGQIYLIDFGIARHFKPVCMPLSSNCSALMLSEQSGRWASSNPESRTYTPLQLFPGYLFHRHNVEQVV
jgi:serine/threonine protein kinase